MSLCYLETSSTKIVSRDEHDTVESNTSVGQPDFIVLCWRDGPQRVVGIPAGTLLRLEMYEPVIDKNGHFKLAAKETVRHRGQHGQLLAIWEALGCILSGFWEWNLRVLRQFWFYPLGAENANTKGNDCCLEQEAAPGS